MVNLKKKQRWLVTYISKQTTDETIYSEILIEADNKDKVRDYFKAKGKRVVGFDDDVNYKPSRPIVRL